MMDYVHTYHSLHLFRPPAGSDYTSISREVTFAARPTMATVSVEIIDDSVIGDIEMFTASLSTSQENVVIVNGTATITIVDDDG